MERNSNLANNFINIIKDVISNESTYEMKNLSNLNITSNTTVSDNIEITSHVSFLSAKTLIAIVILLIYTIANSVFEKLHFHYIHESGVCMILGFLIGLVSLFVNPLVIFILLF
jgi:hypothetical protein